MSIENPDPTGLAIRSSLLAALAGSLAAATLVLYAPTLGFDFIHYDDPNYVWRNLRVLQGLTWDNLRWAMTAFEVGNWHPLTLISHMADVSLFGLRPGAHHLVNALLHAADVALLFLLFASATRRPYVAAVVAALFAVHPLNVESVAWISQRKSVLAMFFLLLALNAHVVWARGRGAIWYIWALLAFVAALASKPIAVVGPALLLLLDAWPLERLRGTTLAQRLRCAGGLVVEKLPYLAFGAAAAVVTVIAQERGGAIGTLEHFPPVTRLANAVFAYAWYPMRAFWPTDLSLFYPASIPPPVAWRVAGAAILLVAAAAVAVAVVRRAPYVTFGAAWYAVALFPVAGLVQFGTQIVADRYAYLSLIGVFVAVAYAGADLVERSSPAMRRFVAAVATAMAIALVVAQQGALASWRNSESVLACGVLRAPDNAHALTNFGLWLVAAERFDEGIAILKRAEAVVPLFPPIHVRLGYAYERQGRLQEARAHYEEALRLGGNDAGVARQLGGVLASLGDETGAEARLREAIALDPESSRAHVLLGSVLYNQGRAAEALPLLERAVILQPDDVVGKTALGLVLEALGRRGDALAALEEATRLDPSFERARVELERIRSGRDPGSPVPIR